jgi:hypothetical protein
MPLIIAERAEEGATDPAHEQARKIHPRYARGELVRVAVGSNLAEAELIKGVLLEQGIPSLLRRTGGFDVPDFLAAGPRDVLVPSSGEEAARDLLTEIDGEAAAEAGDEAGGAGEAASGSRAWQLRVAAALLAALLLFGAIFGVVFSWL